MANATRIKIKITAGQLQAMYRSYAWLLSHWVIEGHHDLLLYHHAAEFKTMYEEMLAKQAQPKYTLKFTELQAVAFCQLWDDNHKYLHEYEQLTIYNINATIDKERKRLKPLIQDDTTRT
ncbi:MAG: hypothetical protein ACK4EY_14560 [Flavipsychrobacter sp.]